MLKQIKFNLLSIITSKSANQKHKVLKKAITRKDYGL